MIEPITHNFHQSSISYLQTRRYVPKLLLLALLAGSMSSSADNHYLFPSDILDNAKRDQYEQERSGLYRNQRQWQYPEESGRNYREPSTPPKVTPNYPGSNQYITIDGQAAPYQTKPGYGSRYPESEHYKYGDVSAEPVPAYPPAETNRSYLPQNYASPSQAVNINQYPREAQVRLFSGRQSDSAMPYDVNAYTQPRYAEENSADKVTDEVNQQGNYPYLLFPKDIGVERQFMNPKYRGLANPFPANQAQQPGTQAQIRYVPVPAYGVPGTLPGTVPGVVTPGNMVPGYSHLSPNYNNFHSYPGAVHMPVNPFNTFQSLGNPFGPFYNYYNNNSFNNFPFASPNYLMPGLSVPNRFSTSQ